MIHLLTKSSPRRTPLTLCALLTLITLAAGCETVESRIKDNQALFDSYPANVQQNVREGKVEVGYTQDMVQIAFGQPSYIQRHTSAAGTRESWVYTGSYYTTDRVVYRPYFRSDKRRETSFHDEWIDVEHKYDRIRIEFESGKVKSIDQIQR